MSKILALDAKVTVRRGQEHFWRVICELDKAGVWSIADVYGRSNGDAASVRDYLRKLIAGSYVRAEFENSGSNTYYRLAKTSREAPRLRRDGTEIPEPLQERLWRAMKLVKTFTAAELAGSVEPVADAVATDSYCKLLARAGVLSVATKGNPAGGKAAYRLIRGDLGLIAPKILRTKLVYDPNGNQILGVAEAKGDA